MDWWSPFIPSWNSDEVFTSKYYFKTYFNGPDEARTRVLLLTYLTS